MKELLINTLLTLGYPVKLQGSIEENEICPESFFTYWNYSTDDDVHYDNEPIDYIWEFSVNFYSVYPELVNIELLNAKNLLQEQGFIISGKGYDIASDEPTQTGRGMRVLKIEK